MKIRLGVFIIFLDLLLQLTSCMSDLYGSVLPAVLLFDSTKTEHVTTNGPTPTFYQIINHLAETHATEKKTLSLPKKAPVTTEVPTMTPTPKKFPVITHEPTLFIIVLILRQKQMLL